ncbi:MAG: nitrile hydratase subunit alpha [Alphaproteobacteria bacterium]|nr:nitrile hydratase subunit alpha [Pseudomonadota bacterium]TDI63796.1 MAG: nitrile hydratase subunit alpha [Alphaproteobacteria bacterium]
MTDATSSGGHGHIHRESGPPQPDDKVHSYYQILGIALQELLIEKGIVSADEVRQMIERRDAITPARGAKIVARAWTDGDFKARLLADGNAGAAELDCPMTYTELVAVENTPKAHNVIVCTLCSCYPRELLGLPPSWYKSREYRARVVRDPRAVLKEFGTEIGDHVEIRVHDSTADIRYLVIPRRPAGTEGMTESELEDLVTRDSMIGVAEAKTPGK